MSRTTWEHYFVPKVRCYQQEQKFAERLGLFPLQKNTKITKKERGGNKTVTPAPHTVVASKRISDYFFAGVRCSGGK
jgi:hypothetical protein